jgi:hypothetical protein
MSRVNLEHERGTRGRPAWGAWQGKACAPPPPPADTDLVRAYAVFPLAWLVTQAARPPPQPECRRPGWRERLPRAVCACLPPTSRRTSARVLSTQPLVWVWVCISPRRPPCLYSRQVAHLLGTAALVCPLETELSRCARCDSAKHHESLCA